MKPSILVLYDPYCLHTLTVLEHLNSFGIYLDAKVHYCAAVDHAKPMISFGDYDAIIIHYSVRVALGWHISPEIETELLAYQGPLAMFVQDEYDNVNQTHVFIDRHKPNLFFTCVPKAYREKIYPTDKFPNIKFVQNLTGYVPANYTTGKTHWKPLEERANLIGYRGRKLPAQYGKLGREKFTIAKSVRDYCQAHNHSVDIEWEDTKRIYNDDWYKFLSNSRASLGTESGSNVFDFKGEIYENIQAHLTKSPEAGFDELWKNHVKPYDDFIRMNQISPRLFECIALGTVLVLFEGDYSGILKPHIHYIPLKKDFSNISEVMAMLYDNEVCEQLRQKAYDDVVQSGKYSYAAFIRKVCSETTKVLPRGSILRLKQKPDVIKSHILLPRPATYRIHGLATNYPIDVTDFSVTPAPPQSTTSTASSPQAYPKTLSRLAPFFPHALKRPIKSIFFKTK